MKSKINNSFNSLLGLIVGSILALLFSVSVNGEWCMETKGYGKGVYIYDSLGFYMVLLCCVVSLVMFLYISFLNSMSRSLVFFSVFLGLVCFCSSKMMVFWICYEVSMMLLLMAMVKDSEYSERYKAALYFLFYIMMSASPLLLGLIYLSYDKVGLDLGLLDADSVESSKLVLGILSMMFMTKIPLFPFHSWLPVVHSEASSVVSMCLSGYVMKLGLLGLCRFCSGMLYDDVFKEYYLMMCFFVSLLFFCVSMTESDCKRWLAFLSLAHMVVCVGLLSFGSFYSVYMCFSFALGHGLSAVSLFLMFWWSSKVVGSRNWLVIREGLGMKGLSRWFVMVCLGMLASLPPTLSFFVELFSLLVFGSVNSIVFILFCCYIMLGGVVPLVMVGFMLMKTGRVWYSYSLNEFIYFKGLLLLIVVNVLALFFV